MTKVFVFLGAINGFLAVALGAFGAHALRERLSVEMLEVYKTGVQYHMAHALALLLVGLLAERWRENRLLQASGWLFFAGIVLFAGSLYALAVSGTRILGAITPLGGLCFLAGWLLLAVAAARD
jgi:uncharacterized membrane protein YgdD (TMEM256/DUF423 family)